MTAATNTPTLAGMAARVYAVNEANGWFDEDRAFGDDIALLHSEVSEMFEAYRDHGFEDVTQTVSCDCQVSTSGIRGMHHSTECARFKLPKPEGFGSEAADVLVRLLDTDYRHGLGFSWSTLDEVGLAEFHPALTPGEHIAQLHLLISCITPDLPLSPVLSYLKAWTDYLGIDLQAEFDRKLEYNATRGYRHGGKRV